MRRSALAGSLCLLLALGLAGCDDEADAEKFSATLSSANEVPSNPSTATGSATFEIEGTNVRFDLNVSGVTAVTMAHIHSGAAGANGPIRVNLFTGPTTGALTGTLASGTFTAADVQTITFDALLAELRAGTAYVNVHTTAQPAGEIRGQVALR
jgi:hypothetical protein